MHVVNAFADKTNKDTDIHAGHLCYRWAEIVKNALDAMGLKCFNVSWGGRAGVDRKGFNLSHNYIMVGTSNFRGFAGPNKSCQSILDPWISDGDPTIFEPKSDGGLHDPNYVGDPANQNGSDGGEYNPGPFKGWQPTGPLK